MAYDHLFCVKRSHRAAIRYVCDPKKTTGTENGERKRYVTFINCTERDAADQFGLTKRMWSAMRGRDMTRGVSCIHAVHSFRGKDIGAEKAHEIGTELARRLWGDRYEAVVATHCNTDNYHVHIIINSVSVTDGERLAISPRHYHELREESNRLSREHGLPVAAEEGARKRRPYKEFTAGRSGKITLRSLICRDIDRAAAASMSPDEFFRVLEEMGYEVSKRYGTAALRPPGAERFFAFSRLPGHTPDDIKARIASNRRRTDPFPEADVKAAERLRRGGAGEKDGLAGTYARYCRELRILLEHPGAARVVPFRVREDMVDLEKLEAEADLMRSAGVETAEDLRAFRAGQTGEMDRLTDERRLLRNAKHRAHYAKDDKRKRECAGEARARSRDMRKVRKNLRLCDVIEERYGYMPALLAELEAERTVRKEETDHGRIRGGRGGADRQDEPGRN